MPRTRRGGPSILLRHSWWIFGLAFVVVALQQLGWRRVGHALAAPGRVLLIAAAVLWPLVLACVFVLPRVLAPPLRVSPTEVESAKDRLQLANDRLKAQNDVRTGLLQGLGGVMLVAGAYVSWRQVRASLDAQVGEPWPGRSSSSAAPRSRPGWPASTSWTGGCGPRRGHGGRCPHQPHPAEAPLAATP